MKIFTNKKIWQKIVIIVLLLMFFQLVVSTPVHAGADVLLEPVTGLFANLGDGIMEIMQKTFLGAETSGAWVEESSNTWLKILTIAAAIVVAVVAVIATIYSGGAALAVFATAFGAVVNIAAGATVVYFALDILHIGESGFYLPDYYLTPETIFKNEVLAFDVNFFNPKEHNKNVKKRYERTFEYDTGKISYDGEAFYEAYWYEKDKGTGVGVDGKVWEPYFEDENGTSQITVDYIGKWVGHNKTGVYSGEGFRLDTTDAAWYAEAQLDDQYSKFKLIKKDNTKLTMQDGELITETCSKDYEKDGDSYSGHYETLEYFKLTYDLNEQEEPNSSSDDIIVEVKVTRLYYNGWTSTTEHLEGNKVIKEEKLEVSPARILQPIVSAWYVTLRNIALVALLSVLVYIGIRITLSSVASDKAKYKQMLIDWVVALCLVFLMHYIMSFAVYINEKIIEAISSITTTNLYSPEDVEGDPDYTTKDTNAVKTDNKDNEDEQQAGVQLFMIENDKAVKNAYKTLVGDKGADSSFYKRFTNQDKSDSILFWPANDFMTQARLLGQGATVADGEDDPDLKSKNVSVAKAGYNIIYVVLVIYTVIFCFTYLKRLIYLAFLTIIAPLVAITYPIDKLNDGQAQAFNMWLKEYIFNLLIQPMHLILYTILVGSAMEFAAINIFYVVVALGFLIPAEKLLRRFFGFEKAQTPGAFGGVAGAALMMSGLGKLLHPPKSSKGALGSGGNGKDDEEQPTTPPWKDKDYDATDNLIGMGGQNQEARQSEFRNDLNEEEQGRLDLARTGREEALEGLNGATTDQERQEYQSLLDSYENDINQYRNPNRSLQNNNQNGAGNGLSMNPAARRTQRPRKRSRIRGFKRAGKSYLTGVGKNMVANHKAKGGFVRRGVRMATGVAAGTLAASAGGLIGIATGDPSKAMQYMATGAAGGYAVGKGVVNNTADKLKVEGTFKEAQKGYYGDDYKKHMQDKYKKDFIRNEENLRKIEDKLKIERKEAKKIMENSIPYYLDHEISDMDDIIATYKLEKEAGMSREQAVATAQYATQVMNGEDTRTMTAKRKKEYKDTFIPKFQQKGSRNAQGDVDKLFKNVDRFYGYKK